MDPARFASAAARFRAFFDEVRGAFLEREDVLSQMAFALLSKEHVLLAGPPGTAKSQIVGAVLGRIVSDDSKSPSLFARQITESTVHTDLVGPIDFKNLTETGRTTHFTDEGMLGSVHAFLDEVFDGRDMLLRSALNVLQERELKQGGTVTKGRIECAVMTSNRYVSDVLDQSRETLLAFVDRIAFIGFVPRGFADPSNLRAVLRKRVAGAGGQRLDALLTLQDVDVLQAAVDEVFVAPEIADALATLLGSLDAEMASARRADPAFSPTRYISTRTAVRCGAILRAACVYDKIFRMPDRELEVEPRDLMSLRLHLLLAGPSRDEIEKLLAIEVDPLEKRQLMIMRTEREIFEACFGKLGVIKPTRRPLAPKNAAPIEGDADATGTEEPSPPKGVAAAATIAQLAARGEIDRRVRQVKDAELAQDLVTLASATRELASMSREGAPFAEIAFDGFTQATAALEMVALRSATSAATTSGTLLQSTAKVVELAGLLDEGRASSQKTATFMRRRALSMVDDAIALAGSGAAFRGAAGDGDPTEATSKRLDDLKRLMAQRRSLLKHGNPDGAADDGLVRAFERVEEELVALWSGAFARSFAGKSGDDRTLDGILEALRPELGRLRQIDQLLEEVVGRPTRVLDKVAGPRLGVLAQSALEKTRPGDRVAFVSQVGVLLETLTEFGLRRSVDVGGWLTHAASALVAAEPAPRDEKPGGFDRKRFFAMRGAEQRTPIACTLAEVALLVAPELAASEDAAMDCVAAAIDGLPDSVKDGVARHDLARIERSVEYLERWWASLDVTSVSVLVKSEILDVLWDDAALARFSVEARLVEEAVPGAREAAKALRARLDALNVKAHAASVAILEARAAEDWRRVAAKS